MPKILHTIFFLSLFLFTHVSVSRDPINACLHGKLNYTGSPLESSQEKCSSLYARVVLHEFKPKNCTCELCDTECFKVFDVDREDLLRIDCQGTQCVCCIRELDLGGSTSSPVNGWASPRVNGWAWTLVLLLAYGDLLVV